jgi:integrase
LAFSLQGGLRFKFPKNNKGRTITLPTLLVEALREHKSTQDGMKAMMGPNYNTEDLVFPRHDGAIWKPEQFTDSYFRFARKIGVKVRFHDLRHTHASQLLRAGVPVKVVSERLGHSAVGITLDTYSHVLPGMQEEAAQKIDAALRAAMEMPRLV